VRIVFFGNNWLGWQTLRWLVEQGETIAALVPHAKDETNWRDELIRVVGSSVPIIEPKDLQKPETIAQLKSLKADLGLSVLFKHWLKKEALSVFSKGAVNLHPSYLPYNRGVYPNVWSILEGTQAGATLHYMDEGLDTGDIIAQRKVATDPWDTGETLYRKLEREALTLFKEIWPAVKAGKAPRTPQKKNEGTAHTFADIRSKDAIDLEKKYSGRELLDLLRARTFPPYSGAHFEANGRRIDVQISFKVSEKSGEK
jgi:methionyl-tRNA formyltransferase